jgi:hypothetical protein
MREKEWNSKRLRALRRCHQMSGSPIRLVEKPKINSTSRNMHITGKEKTLAAKSAQEARAAGLAVSSFGSGGVKLVM